MSTIVSRGRYVRGVAVGTRLSSSSKCRSTESTMEACVEAEGDGFFLLAMSDGRTVFGHYAAASDRWLRLKVRVGAPTREQRRCDMAFGRSIRHTKGVRPRLSTAPGCPKALWSLAVPAVTLLALRVQPFYLGTWARGGTYHRYLRDSKHGEVKQGTSMCTVPCSVRVPQRAYGSKCLTVLTYLEVK